jgi:hypothetical protein
MNRPAIPRQIAHPASKNLGPKPKFYLYLLPIDQWIHRLTTSKDGKPTIADVALRKLSLPGCEAVMIATYP